MNVLNIKTYEMALKNVLYISKNQFDKLSDNKIIIIKGLVFKTDYDLSISDNDILIHKIFRKYINININDKIKFEECLDIIDIINEVEIEISSKIIDENTVCKFNVLINSIKVSLNNSFVNNNQIFLVEVDNIPIECKIKYGVNKCFKIVNATKIKITNKSNMKIIQAQACGPQSENIISNVYNNFDLSSSNFNLQLGGLKNEIDFIIKNVLTTFLLKKNTIEKLDIKHSKGILIHGLSGCGKTLLAKEIVKILNIDNVQYVNSPEILDKYIGGTEKKIREIFMNIKENEKNIIILDEFDSIASVRKNNYENNDNIVNQLLTLIDGLNEYSNILVIAITNRFDIIDKSLLRAGRFEIQIEIGLPDKKARHEILNIHAKKYFENNLIDQTVDLEKIANMTNNYTGAELRLLIQRSYVHSIYNNVMDKNLTEIDEKSKIKNSDILYVLNESKSLYSNESKSLYLNPNNFEDTTIPNILTNYNDDNDSINNSIKIFINNNINKYVLLLKSKNNNSFDISIKNIIKSGIFDYYYFITNSDMINYTNNEKINYIKDIFNIAKYNKKAMIIIDKLENIVEYNYNNKEFSNYILNNLKSIIEKEYNNNIFIMIKSNVIYLPFYNFDVDKVLYF